MSDRWCDHDDIPESCPVCNPELYRGQAPA